MIRVEVDLITQAVVYQVNTLMQMGYRIEHHRCEGGRHMMDNQESYEQALRVWLTEQKLERVHFELYSPQTNTAYEHCEVEISYLAEPKTTVTKPPVAKLEELLTTLAKLPRDAQFRLVVHVADGATEIPGWSPTSLRDLYGGLKEEHVVGDEAHGYGPVEGRVRYYVSNYHRNDGEAPNGR
jgi:hypothetical protein